MKRDFPDLEIILNGGVMTLDEAETHLSRVDGVMIGRAAYRTGVPVDRTKIIAYAICGLFAGMGGLVLTASTGIGAPIPGPYLLASVAAVVLGGVVLGGGKGGLFGPIVAVLILRLVRTILTLMAVDPNVTTIVEGTIMVAVVMLGGILAMRGQKR